MRFAGLGSACASCHGPKDAHRGALGTQCEQCHTPVAWRSASRAFHKATLFPLEGRHLAAPCASCHVAGVTKGTPTKCFDCHWIRRRDDPYETRLGSQCEMCHRPTSWTAVNWNHTARTGFALNLAHRVLDCGSCHKDRRFAGTGFNCVSCHLQTYQQTSRPNHAAAGFPTTCEACHKPSQTSWTQAAFNHAAFPLVGLHATQPCANCHKNGVYKGTPRDCVGCHLADYQKTTQSRTTRRPDSRRPATRATGRPTRAGRRHRVQPRERLPAGRPARDAGVRELPQERRLQGHAARLRRLPPGRLPAHDQSEPRGVGNRDDLRNMSQADRHELDGQRVQPREHLRARRPARDAAVRQLPQERRLQGHAARLRRLPPGRLPAHDQSEPRGGGNRDDLRELSPGRPTRAGRAAGSTTRAPSRWSACTRRSRAPLPQERRLQGHAARLRRLPPGRLPADDEPEPRGGRVPDDVRGVPQGHRHELGAAAPSTTRAPSRSSACMRRRRARAATRTASTRARRATASAATWPTTSGRPIRTTRRPDSRRPATRATAPPARPGRARCSITPASSRSSACMRRSRARTATRTASTGARRATASAATWPATRARPIRTTRQPGSRPPATRATGRPTRRGIRASSRTRRFRLRPAATSGLTCATCHTTPNVFAVFSCIAGCHARASTDSHHSGRAGYRYDSAACYSCHPNGRAGRPRPQP